ncbi:hypothetical protein [Brevundimonas viscosa]|uniref:Uncharacterized protein n=1 Tax=Brevundimonas viscosa TaxID=871741 RepID=A0A1I6PRW1_9CAUL|nr:hypothetical protein [Brevundimonas viscosa]SFS42954.1 hypothetical protein SAMN05192570_1226 [Brevundimonas viscosa]
MTTPTTPADSPRELPMPPYRFQDGAGQSISGRHALSASPARGEGEPERMLCNICKRPVNAGHPSEWCTCHPYMAPAGTHAARGEGDAPFTADDLANEIRRVDGNHSLGAGALAEALMPFLSRPSPGEGDADRLMQDFYLSADYDPKAARPADTVKAAIAFALRTHPTPATPAGDEMLESDAAFALRHALDRLQQVERHRNGEAPLPAVIGAIGMVEKALAALQPQAEGGGGHGRGER